MPSSAPAVAAVTHDNALPPKLANGNADTSIRPLCAQLAARLDAFLASEPESEMLRGVQEQTRTALGVITAALEKYT